MSEVSSWKKKKHSKELSKGYIKTFFKLKTEDNGWPTCNCKFDNENQICRHKLQYLQDYEQTETIKLEFCEVNRNEELRLISKILLNSFLGYLGMRENLPKTRYVITYFDVMKFFTSNLEKFWSQLGLPTL